MSIRRASPALVQGLPTKFIQLDRIRIDGDVQQRAEIREEHVADLAEAYKADESLPPGKAFADGSEIWLSRGFHRFHARRRAGFADMELEVVQGTQREAILDAVGDNAEHRALPRSRADKRRAVETLLADPEWGQWSDREIARRCQVGRSLVGEIRILTVRSDSERVFVTKHGTQSVMKTGGRRKQQQDVSPPPPTPQAVTAEQDDPDEELDELEAALRDEPAPDDQQQPWAAYNAKCARIAALMREAGEIFETIVSPECKTDEAFTDWIKPAAWRKTFKESAAHFDKHRVANLASQVEAAKLERAYLYVFEAGKKGGAR